MWRFENKTTPLLNPNIFGLESPTMVTECGLPCESGSVRSLTYYYFVLAIENFNAESMKIRFNVPWNIDCNSST
jgi:hypothetical protein